MEKERELVLVESGLMFADYWQGTPGVGLFGITRTVDGRREQTVPRHV
jgi:hypothetical protein